jgi:hypothetical protein
MNKKINYQDQIEIAGILADPQNIGLRLKEDAILLSEKYLILTDDVYLAPAPTAKQEIDEIKVELTLFDKVRNSFNSLLGFLKLKNLDSGISQVN